MRALRHRRLRGLRPASGTGLGLLLLAPTTAHAEDGDEPTVLVVEALRDRGSASERHLDRAAIEAWPVRGTGDLLQAMPGLQQSAHGGHGKAHQYFLRGFDAEHGADLAVSLEGIPLNEASNVHGHGYLDLHLLPPLLVRGLSLSPGPWRPETGDFAVAGSADLRLGLEDPGLQAWLGGGTDLSGRATLAWRPEDATPGTFVVTDADLGQGVGMGRSWRQLRGAAGVERPLGDGRLRAFVLAYDGAYASPGVLREDDLAAGDVDFYDAYPGSGGGRSSQVLGAVQTWGSGARTSWRGTLYGGWRALAIEQNFTGWTHEDVGDATRQVHGGWRGGVQAEGRWSPGPATLRGGLALRLDRIDQEEHWIDPEGKSLETLAARSGLHGDLGAWAGAVLDPTPWLRLEPGLRAGAFLLAPDEGAAALRPVLAPTLTLALARQGPVSGFASYGRGFRSPELRDPTAPPSLADSVEAGIRADVTDAVGLRAAAFLTLVSDEVLFDHAVQRFLGTGATLRRGVDVGLVLRPLGPLRIEVDGTASEGHYRADGAPIPYAPRLLGALGVSLEDLSLGEVGVTAGLRGRAIAPRPLPGGFASHPAGTLDGVARVDWGPWSLTLDVENLLGTRWRDGEFLFPSRWDQEGPHSQLPVRHFTAGAPPSARLALGRRFP